MPLPSPRDKEKRSAFMNRCMLDLAGKEEFKDNKQRAAVCYSQFKKGASKASVIVGDDDETFYCFLKEPNK
jgi:hypothetical protein